MFDIKKLKDDPDINIYSKKHEIDAILKGFANQKKQLIVIPVPFNDEYTSTIIGVGSDYVRLDSVVPKNGNAKLLEASYIKVNFKFSNNEHYFLSKLYDYKKNDEDFLFDIYKPLEILSLEKRKFFRIEPSLSNPVKLSFIFKDGLCATTVFDMSGEGISFLLDVHIEKYTVIENAKIEFPYDLPSILLRIEVKSVSRLDNLKYKVGAQIINIKPKEQDIMFNYIFKRQREMVAAMKGIV